MEAIWDYLMKSPLLVLFLVAVVGFLLSRFGGGSDKAEVSKEDLVPHYKRFERREPELGDRRKGGNPGKVEADQRKAGRRARD